MFIQSINNQSSFSKSKITSSFAKNKIFKIIISTLIVGTFSSCNSEGEVQAKDQKVFERDVQVVRSISIPSYRSAPGQIVSKNQSQISSRMMGYITAMNVTEGDYVSKGQVLATIDPVDVQGQLEIAESSKDQAQAALADAKADFERFDRLLKENAVTLAQWEKMKLNYEMAVERASQASSGLKIANSQTKYTTIKSPINGVVSRKMLRAGDLASPGYPFLTIENPKELEILTQVPAALYEKIKSEDKVCFYNDSKPICDLIIESRVPVADPMSHTHLIILKLGSESQKLLHGGAFTEVYFPVGSEEMIAIDTKSIIKRAGLNGVFVVNEKQEAQFRMVRFAESHGTAAEGHLRIQSGLKSGDYVLKGDLQNIQNADKIVVLKKVEASNE